jgi:hypothetical protein
VLPSSTFLHGSHNQIIEAVILDFDRAEVSHDIGKLAKEANRVEEMLQRAMSGKAPIEYLSKEARKLL